METVLFIGAHGIVFILFIYGIARLIWADHFVIAAIFIVAYITAITITGILFVHENTSKYNPFVVRVVPIPEAPSREVTPRVPNTTEEYNRAMGR